METATIEKITEQNGLQARYNSCLTNDPCAICGGWTSPNGFDFMTTKLRLVCDRCVESYAPDLYRAHPRAQQYPAAEYAPFTPSPTVEAVIAAIKNLGEQFDAKAFHTAVYNVLLDLRADKIKADAIKPDTVDEAEMQPKDSLDHHEHTN